VVTVEEWSQIMENYGAKIWPAQIVFYVVAVLLTVWLFIKPGRIQNILMKTYLSISFAWVGIIYYFILAKNMAVGTYMNYVIGSFFIIVSVLFAVDIFRNKMCFSLPRIRWLRYTTIVLTILVFSYHWIGMTFGHDFPNLIIVGTLPCPTVTFGLILLTTSLPRVSKTIYILLLIMAIPFTPFFQIARYGVYEDIILFAVGVYSTVLLIKNWKIKDKNVNANYNK
jgi:hypothetical protein